MLASIAQALRIARGVEPLLALADNVARGVFEYADR
jgi:hypothetical protein